MVGSGDRSEKVRTYNFPQDRVTDHRIGKTVHNLPSVMDGDLDELIDALQMADQADRLAGVTGGGRCRLRRSTVRYIEPRVRPIVRATDLGSVQVLKHGNLYLLTDPFGDIHPDSRGLGLYHGDTRILSCSVLRVHGERPVLLQGSAGANYRGSIQLTNPSADRNPDAKVHPGDALVGRTIGISRDRLVSSGAFEERIRIVNHASRAETISIELELGADGADIFEVRGYPRPARGTLRPVATTPDRVTFRVRRPGRPAAQHVRGVLRGGRIAWTRSRPTPATRSTPAPPCASDGRSRSTRTRRARSAGRPGRRRPRSPPIPKREHPGGPVPGRADGQPRRGRGRLPRLAARDHGHLERPRAVQPRRRPLASPTCVCSSTRAPATTSATSRPASRGSPRSSAATRSSRRCRASPSGRSSRSRPCPCSRRTRPPRSTIGATPSPARSSTSCGPGRWREAASCRTRRTTARSTARPLWLILLGETFDWTGDRALVDRLWPNALAALEWIDRYGDLDGDGFVEYHRRSERGLLNQGWKDSSDADPRPRRQRGGPADRPRRGPGLRVRGQATDGRTGPGPRRGRARRPPRPRGRSAPRALRGGVLGRGPPLLRPRARRGQAPGRRHRLERRPVPVDGHRVDRSGARTWSTACSARRCRRGGGSGRSPPTRPGTTRSATTRARSGRTTRR